MASEKHLEILWSGREGWNSWRGEHPDIVPNLANADLTSSRDFYGMNLGRADLSNSILWRATFDKTNLQGADLRDADLKETRFESANLNGAKIARADLTDARLLRSTVREAGMQKADLSGASLARSDLSGANLAGANLQNADLRWATLKDADLTGANLEQASLVDTDLTGASLSGSRVYGISAWAVKTDERTSQRDLIITPQDKDTVTVDNLEVAQFIYLLLNNKKIRGVIDTVTSKLVLILGRFTEERKMALDAMRDELRKRDHLPVLFDFEKPDSRDLTETISTLAHLARFVIADITEARSVPQELQRITSGLDSLPIQPIILEGQHEYGMFSDFGGKGTVLSLYRYRDTDHLLESLEDKIIGPALTKAEEIRDQRKAFAAKLGQQR